MLPKHRGVFAAVVAAGFFRGGTFTPSLFADNPR
jgi:hypothetical protein